MTCGFCSELGHNMTKCNHVSATHLKTEFDNVCAQCDGDAFIVLDWLQMTLLKNIKMLALKTGVSRTGAKHTIISSIMDKIFPDYPNPIWHLEYKKCLLIMSRTSRMTIDMMSFQTELIALGIMIEAVHSTNSLHRTHITALYAMHIEFYVEYCDRYIDRHVKRKCAIMTVFKNEIPTAEAEVVNECSICYEDLTRDNKIQLNCSHSFCDKCVTATLLTATLLTAPSCALCRTQYNTFTICNPVVHTNMQQHIA